MREAEYAIFADKHNWKYAWFGEHHCLTEYSHMSAPEVVMGLVAGQTDYIHLASGINSLSPRKEHPVRLAERAAMLDHVTGRRYEWGTGRGAGSHELAAFNILDTNSTKAEWDEVVREIPRMWEQVDYSNTRRALHGADPSQRASQAVRPGPPADLGRLRQPADVPEGRRARHRRDRLQLRADLQPPRAASRRTRRASRTARSRSASS